MAKRQKMRKKTFKSNAVRKATSEAMSGTLIETDINIDLKYKKKCLTTRI